MGEEGATVVETPVSEAVEKVSTRDEIDDSWLDDDGRDHGREPGPVIGSAVWWCVSAGIMLLLPRQWASAGIAFAIALILTVIKRKRHPRPDAPPRDPSTESSAGQAPKNVPRAADDA